MLRHPVAMGYTLAAGFIFGSFIVYLGTSQQIFAEQYGQGAYFALWFAFFAGGMAVAMMVNARLVMRYGMRQAVEAGVAHPSSCCPWCSSA